MRNETDLSEQPGQQTRSGSPLQRPWPQTAGHPRCSACTEKLHLHSEGIEKSDRLTRWDGWNRLILNIVCFHLLEMKKNNYNQIDNEQKSFHFKAFKESRSNGHKVIQFSFFTPIGFWWTFFFLFILICLTSCYLNKNESISVKIPKRLCPVKVVTYSNTPVTGRSRDNRKRPELQVIKKRVERRKRQGGGKPVEGFLSLTNAGGSFSFVCVSMADSAKTPVAGECHHHEHTGMNVTGN